MQPVVFLYKLIHDLCVQLPVCHKDLLTTQIKSSDRHQWCLDSCHLPFSSVEIISPVSVPFLYLYIPIVPKCIHIRLRCFRMYLIKRQTLYQQQLFYSNSMFYTSIFNMFHSVTNKNNLELQLRVICIVGMEFLLNVLQIKKS